MVSASHTEMKNSLRKTSKPQIEKRRRDRINNSIESLRILLLDKNTSTQPKSQKMEKADILEMVLKTIPVTMNHKYTDGIMAGIQLAANVLSDLNLTEKDKHQLNKRLNKLTISARNQNKPHVTPCQPLTVLSNRAGHMSISRTKEFVTKTPAVITPLSPSNKENQGHYYSPPTPPDDHMEQRFYQNTEKPLNLSKFHHLSEHTERPMSVNRSQQISHAPTSKQDRLWRPYENMKT